jgi:peptide deformylase
MAPLEFSTTILKTRISEFDFKEPPVDAGDLVISLYEFMLKNTGIGLAANQVGLPYRCFVMYPNMAIFNPRVIMYSQETTMMDEYCLSYPGKKVRIKRSSDIFVTYQDVYGQHVSRAFDGIHARVFQHEMGHLNGIVHLDKASRANIIEAGKVVYH